jgi:hypothetical protein
MATLKLWPVMVTADEVEELAEAVRALGHEVTIGAPEWARYIEPRDRVLHWIGSSLRASEVRQIAAASGSWAQNRWTDRWRPSRLGYINTRGQEYPIDFLD